MAQGDKVVDVVVVTPLDDDIDHLIKDGALLHGGLRGSGLDVALDLLRNLVHAVHVKDLLAGFPADIPSRGGRHRSPGHRGWA